MPQCNFCSNHFFYDSTNYAVGAWDEQNDLTFGAASGRQSRTLWLNPEEIGQCAINRKSEEILSLWRIMIFKSWIWWDLCIGWVYAWLTAHEGTNQGSYKLHQTNVCQTYPCPRQRTGTPNTKNDRELAQAQIHTKPIVSGRTRCALICWAPWEKFDLVTLEYLDKIIIG